MCYNILPRILVKTIMCDRDWIFLQAVVTLEHSSYPGGTAIPIHPDSLPDFLIELLELHIFN